MPKVKRTRLWRWRSNPLRRRDDIVEAWIVLAVWTVVALGGTLVGTVTAHAADESFAQFRAERHSVEAVLLESTQAGTTAENAGDNRTWAKVRWTASDGSTRTGRTMVESGHKAGSKVVVWINGQGRLAVEPLTATAAEDQAIIVGAAAALAFGGLAFGAGRVARWRLDQRRYDQWGREWDQVGPQWKRKTT
ncbi:hypothetical protein ACFVYG_46105 [Streptomyces sp. NPDC058256]|uniref:Rv1733c family protein n=1 Tax=Streptomyces sp. NPDC058256 TaxID=3346408 RepID=UPI0036EB99F3